MPAWEQMSSLPGEPETPTAPTTSSPTLIGSPPESASTRGYCLDPTDAGSSMRRWANAGEGWLNVRAVEALRSLPSGVCSPDPSPRNITSGNPARSTTVTETLNPMLSHWASAALAMACASASEIFFCVTIPCALAGTDTTVAIAKAAQRFKLGPIILLPVYLNVGFTFSGRNALQRRSVTTRHFRVTAGCVVSAVHFRQH